MMAKLEKLCQGQTTQYSDAMTRCLGFYTAMAVCAFSSWLMLQIVDIRHTVHTINKTTRQTEQTVQLRFSPSAVQVINETIERNMENARRAETANFQPNTSP